MAAMIFKHGLFTATLGLLLVAGGCASPRGGVSIAWRLVENDAGEVEPVQAVTLADTSLAKQINLVPHGFVNNFGALTARTEIASDTASQLELEYRVDWLDDTGAILRHDSVLWHSFTLKPWDKRLLNSNLPFPVAGYKISVRRRQ